MTFKDRFISVNHGGQRTQTDGVVMHSTGSRAQTSQYGWFSNPAAQASSHSHVDNAGEGERYLPDDTVCWANGAGNYRLMAIETQGDGTEPWTAAQLESIAQEVARLHVKYGFPLRLMESSKKTEKGIGYHRLGVPRSKWGVGVWLIAGGEKWSSAVGKICPGDPRIKQMPELLDRVKEIVGDKTPTVVPAKVANPKPVKVKKVTVYSRGSKGAKVKDLQRQLNACFPAYRQTVTVGRGRLLVVDGSYGPATEAWVREFQRRAGLVVDGVCGPLTQAALAKYGINL